MKTQIKNKAAELARARPAETWWSVVGAGLGALVGLFVGGVGITARGGASGVLPIFTVLILALVFGLFGNRIGVWRDQRRR